MASTFTLYSQRVSRFLSPGNAKELYSDYEARPYPPGGLCINCPPVTAGNLLITLFFRHHQRQATHKPGCFPAPVIRCDENLDDLRTHNPGKTKKEGRRKNGEGKPEGKVSGNIDSGAGRPVWGIKWDRGNGAVNIVINHRGQDNRKNHHHHPNDREKSTQEAQQAILRRFTLQGIDLVEHVGVVRQGLPTVRAKLYRAFLVSHAA